MKRPSEGVFITIEGIDGSGKTTITKQLKARLAYHGYFVHLTREPGGSPLAEKIRELIINEKMGGLTELLLFNASRSDHLDTTIQQHIDQRHVVVSDRFSDSSWAYQGYGRGLKEQAEVLEDMVVGQRRPNYILYLKISIEESLKRLNARRVQSGEAPDRLDSESTQFKQRMLEGYASREEDYVIIDAEQDIVDVTRAVCDWVDNVFVPNHPLVEE